MASYWIEEENTMVSYPDIVKARQHAIQKLKNAKVNSGIALYSSQKGKPFGIVSKTSPDTYSWGIYGKKYGWTMYSLYKNGKIQR